MSNWEILQALVFEPRKAFTEIAQRPKFWCPLLVLIVAMGGITVWYTSTVDLGWITDQQLRHNTLVRNLSEEQITQAVQRAQDHRGVQMTVSVIAIVIVVPLGLLIAALYNLLVGKLVGFERSFRQWFSFASWSVLPLALAEIPAALVLATADTHQIAQEGLKPLSLNALVFHRAIGEPGFSVFSAIDVFQLATLYLSLVGVKVWSGRSWLFSILFVGIPWVLIYGIWAWISLR